MKSAIDTLLARLRMKQLQLLIALDEHRSLHKAAAALAMTQSAASKALRELESMVGGPLFERSRTGLVPNASGHCVIGHARRVVSDLAALCDDMADLRAGRGGRLAVGAIMGAVPDVLVPALAQLRATHPDIAVEIVEDTSLRMLELLDDGHLDVVIGRTLVADAPSRYHYQPLGEEAISVVVGHGHPPLRGPRTWTDFAGYRWVVYPGHMPMHAFLQRELDLAGMPFPADTIATASTYATVTLLQADPTLVALLPTAVARGFVRQKVLRIVPLTVQSRNPTFGIVTRKAGALPPAAQQFVRAVLAGQRAGRGRAPDA